MNLLSRILTAPLLAAALAGCAGPGYSYNQYPYRNTVTGAAIGAAGGAGIAYLAGGPVIGAALLGSAAGAGAGDSSARSLQQRYDNAYVQCMYAKGHRVPVYGQFTYRPTTSTSTHAPYVPPPPPPSQTQAQ